MHDVEKTHGGSDRLNVGLFGYYSYRNLGDNLMAFLIARHISATGHEPIILSKSPKALSKWGFKVVTDVSALVSKSDVIVFGGGGLLIPRHNLSGQGLDFSHDLCRLLEDARTKQVPMYGVSLGGSGSAFSEIVPKERQTLLKSLKYVTLRNQEDLHLLQQAGIKGEFLNDLVWTVSRLLPVDVDRNTNRPRIGINLYIGDSRFRLLRMLLQLIAFARSDIDFIFYDIHPKEEDKFGAFSPAILGKNCKKKVLIDIEDACREAASIDLLITTRLHLGVMAMSYGVPSIAYSGQKKTELLYQRLGRSDLFWHSKDMINFIKLFLLPGFSDKLSAIKERPFPPELILNAMQHYDRIDRMLADSANTVTGFQ